MARLIEGDGLPYRHELQCACIMPRIAAAAGLGDDARVWGLAEWLGFTEKFDSGFLDLVDETANPDNDRARAAATLRHYGETGEVEWDL